VTSTSAELFAAIEASDTDRVRVILAADPTLAGSRDRDGVSALMRARYHPDKDLARTVLEHVDELDIFEAATFGDLDRLTELLAYDPASVVERSGDGFTALHFAAFFAGPDVVTFLIARGAQVDARGTGWMTGTPLHSAASSDRIEVARVLLDAGAAPDARQSGGWTPLHAAAHNGSHDLVAMLVAAGAERGAVNDEGKTSLDLAVDGGDPETIALLQR
jgi:ankyrin repeat protein